VPMSQAAAESELIGRALHPEGRMMVDVNGVRLQAGRAGLGVASSSPVPGNLRVVVAAFVAVLMTLVAVVLVIACANLAGALLARATTRRREIAVRLALGVGRMRLIRQLITETALLFLLGGCAGLLLARVLTSVLVSMLPAFPQPVALTFALDYRVVAFAFALSLVAAVLCGLAPALQASRADVISTLKDDAQAPVERLRLRNAFVVAQVAFSILLVVAAAVFVERLQNVSAVDRGFDARGIEIASLDLAMAGYTTETGTSFVETLYDRLREMPNVEATLADRPPAPGRIMGMMGDLTAPGVDTPSGQRGFMGDWYTVAPGFFSALGIPIVAGRDFTSLDRSGTQPVVIVSQSTAQRLWPGQDAVGKTLLWQSGGPDGSTRPKTTLTVIGVATNLGGRHRDVPGALNALTLYVPLRQRYTQLITILARPLNGRRPSREIAAVVAAADRNLPILSAGTLEDELSGPEEVQLRIAASVSASVGLIGVLLAGIGIYGVTAYAVARRTREIGIRLALGADRAAVTGMVLRQGMSLVAVGSVIGLMLAAVFIRVLAGTLFGVATLGAGTLAGAVGLFALIGLLACYAPTRRATGINAVEALRSE
jgi:putative ABC transport system permease protein